MEQPLLGFIDVLRRAGLPIGINQTHTALSAVALVGYDNRQRLQHTLRSVLAADESERILLDDCFAHFFGSASSSSLPQQDDTKKSGPESETSDTLNRLINASSVELQLEIQQAGDIIDSAAISQITQKGLYTRRLLEQLDWPLLQRDILQLQEGNSSGDSGGSGASLQTLSELSNNLLAQAREHIEKQFLLYGKPNTRALREQRLMTTPVRLLDRKQQKELRVLMQQIARRLQKKYRRRNLFYQRGLLDVRSTLRHNMAYDAIPFKPRWRKKHKSRPQVFVVADISGSVAASADLLLGFMACMGDLLPKSRSFVFSNCLGEVTDLYQQLGAEEAQQEAQRQWGGGSTDYGRTIDEFMEQVGGRLKRDSVIVILGDARNNKGYAALDTFKSISQRCHNIYWLNPESEVIWNTGDSIMEQYKPHCRMVWSCRSLADLATFCDHMLKHN
ncbi:MAG: VWA domain-containing protein [Pseudomonadales bacterium]